MCHVQEKSYSPQEPYTPQILELSGIDQADLLSQFDIPAVLELLGVGNSFQDHLYVGVVYSGKKSLLQN